MASHDKPLLHKTTLHSPASNTALDKNKFNASIDGKGYDISLERALKCPCINLATGQARLTCTNCGGSSWLFVNKIQTRAVIQGMNRETKYKQWTAQDAGKASITFRGDIIDVGFMDRVINLDLISNFSQTLYLQQLVEGTGAWVAQTIYFPEEITLAYIFKDDDSPLIALENAVDFSIVENKFTLLNTDVLGEILRPENPVVTIRYTHKPMFHIAEITRERVAARRINCSNSVKTLEQLPIHAIGIRAHQMFDRPGLDGSENIDNTSTLNSQY